jgi:maleylpyruvate isomerase
MSSLAEQIAELTLSLDRWRTTLDRLTEAQVSEPSLLPGWSRGHVLTHVARSADSRRRLLSAARAGRVGRQYESEEQRAREIDEGARRPAAAVLADATAAPDRLLGAVAGHPSQAWEASGEWLGVGLRPVRRVVPSMRRELEYHHVDLAAGYRPADWPAEFVTQQLTKVTGDFGSRPDAPSFTVDVGDRLLPVGDGGRVTVAGTPATVLAWLTGRDRGDDLRVEPAGALPRLPPMS